MSTPASEAFVATPLHLALIKSLKRTYEMYNEQTAPPDNEAALKLRLAVKEEGEYALVRSLPPPKPMKVPATKKQKVVMPDTSNPSNQPPSADPTTVPTITDEPDSPVQANSVLNTASTTTALPSNNNALVKAVQSPLSDLGRPEWHAPWNLYRVCGFIIVAVK